MFELILQYVWLILILAGFALGWFVHYLVDKFKKRWN
jgi:hypothetical protein